MGSQTRFLRVIVSGVFVAFVPSIVFSANADRLISFEDGHAVLQTAQAETRGEQSSAKQRMQQTGPGSVQAPQDLQDPDLTTKDASGGTSARDQDRNACDECRIVRGLVLRSDEETLIVQDASKQEVSLKFGQKTDMGMLSQPRTGTFVEGDRVEAYVKPDGMIWSITALKQQQGQPGVAGAPGD